MTLTELEEKAKAALAAAAKVTSAEKIAALVSEGIEAGARLAESELEKGEGICKAIISGCDKVQADAAGTTTVDASTETTEESDDSDSADADSDDSSSAESDT